MGLPAQILQNAGGPPPAPGLHWPPDLIWLHAAADAVLGACLLALPVVLACVAMRRRNGGAGWTFWLVLAAILACGGVFVAELWAVWSPDDQAEAALKAVAALLTLATACTAGPGAVRALAASTGPPRPPNRPAVRPGEHDMALLKLEQTAASQHLLVNGVTDYAIYMLDPAGRVATWNTDAERIKGYTEAEVVGRDFALFYTEADREAGVPQRSLATAALEGRFEAEGPRVHRDGSTIWVNAVIQPLRDDAGQLVGFTKVVRDITERRQAEAERRESEAMMVQMQKMEAVGQLAGGIAHDFNNLLTVILGGTSLLETDLVGRLDVGESETLAAIGDAAARASGLTQQLLAFSRKQTLAPRVLDANRLIAQMSELLRRTLGERIAIETVLAGGLWKTNADANQLEAAILNLAVNARDAMPDGGKLTLETGNMYLDDAYAAAHQEVKRGEYIMIAVSDTGIGMPEEVVERAFEPFFTTKAEGRGTGLGLSQVFGFVKQSGGHVKLYSEPGQGTTVKIYLPWHETNGAVAAPGKPSYAEVPRGTETVLVVEDHDAVRAYVTNALRHLGYRVLEAPDGRAALELLAGHPEVALLLTDVGLPGLNGRQVAEQARERQPALRVVFMTGYARNAISHRGLLDVGVHLLPKPFTVEQIARKLREVLDA